MKYAGIIAFIFASGLSAFAGEPVKVEVTVKFTIGADSATRIYSGVARVGEPAVRIDPTGGADAQEEVYVMVDGAKRNYHTTVELRRAGPTVFAFAKGGKSKAVICCVTDEDEMSRIQLPNISIKTEQGGSQVALGR